MGKKLKIMLVVLVLLLIGGIVFLTRNRDNYSAKIDDDKIVEEFQYADAYFPGDVNGNNKLDANDYKLIVRYVIKTATLNANQLKAADANGDGKVNPVDYKTIVRKILNHDTNPPSGSVTPSTPSSLGGGSGGGLQYFGYYGPGTDDYDVNKVPYREFLNFQKQINSNVIVLIGFCDQILNDIKNDPVLKTRKIFVHAGEVFWAKDSAAYTVMYNFIERNKNKIDGIMVDEPYWNWESDGFPSNHQYEKNNFIAKSREFRQKYPNMKLIGILAYTELNKNLSTMQEYYQNFTDLGFDYYERWSSQYGVYLDKLSQIANHNQDLWIVNYSFAYTASSALSENEYINILQGQYDLARSNSRVVGILPFILYDADNMKGFRWLVNTKRYTNLLNKHKEIANNIC